VSFVFSPRDPAKRKVENEQVKMAGAESENTLIGGGAGQSLINKTSPRFRQLVFSYRDPPFYFLNHASLFRSFGDLTALLLKDKLRCPFVHSDTWGHLSRTIKRLCQASNSQRWRASGLNDFNHSASNRTTKYILL
jgi:hypothetical protein